MRLVLSLATLLLITACKPPAADEYVERTRIPGGREAPSEPILSPDTKGAGWAPAGEDRLLYGKSGETPLMAIECLKEGPAPQISYTRFAAADPDAKGIMALIGNSHVVRLFIDAKKQGEVWLWSGTVPASDPQLDVLTGSRQVEATVPGAGSIILNASHLPGELIERCRASAPPSPPKGPL